MSYIAKCLQVTCDAIKESEYSRDNDIALADVFYQNPKLIDFIMGIKALRYMELPGRDNGFFYYGRWDIMFPGQEVTNIAVWNYRKPQYELQIYRNLKIGWEKIPPFSSREELLTYAQKYLKEQGYYFESQTETAWKEI